VKTGKKGIPPTKKEGLTTISMSGGTGGGSNGIVGKSSSRSGLGNTRQNGGWKVVMTKFVKKKPIITA